MRGWGRRPGRRTPSARSSWTWSRVPWTQPCPSAPSSAVLAAASPLADADAHSTTRARPSTAVASARATVVAPHDPDAPTTGNTSSPGAGCPRVGGRRRRRRDGPPRGNRAAEVAGLDREPSPAEFVHRDRTAGCRPAVTGTLRAGWRGTSTPREGQPHGRPTQFSLRLAGPLHDVEHRSRTPITSSSVLATSNSCADALRSLVMCAFTTLQK